MALVYERGNITCPAAPQLLRVHTHTPAHARTQNNVSELRKMWFHPSHLLAALLQHECLRLSLPTTDSKTLLDRQPTRTPAASCKLHLARVVRELRRIDFGPRTSATRRHVQNTYTKKSTPADWVSVSHRRAHNAAHP